MQHTLFETTDEALKSLLDALAIKNLPLSNATLVGIGKESLGCAHFVATKLKIPLEFLFTQIISAPLNSECSIAAVSEDMEIVMNEELVSAFGISLDYVYGEAQRRYEEAILPARYQLRHGLGLEALRERDILLFDMGIETGLRMSVAIKTCLNLGAKSICPISPIMPKSIYEYLAEICDDVCCPHVLENYVSSAHYFPLLSPLSDEEFENLLNQTPKTKEKYAAN